MHVWDQTNPKPNPHAEGDDPCHVHTWPNIHPEGLLLYLLAAL